MILGRAAIAKVQLNAPLTAGQSPVTSGPWSLAEASPASRRPWTLLRPDFQVDLVEKEPTIGGKMAQIDKTFPTLDCAACILTPKMVDAAQHEGIQIMAYSQVESVKGFVGNFTVTIRHKARYVDETKCTGCGPVHGKVPPEEGAQRL